MAEPTPSSSLRSLQALLHAIIPANPFYTAKVRAAGVRLPIASLEEYSSQFPFTTKQELVNDQQTHPPYGTNLTFSLNRYIRFHQTSGTTGTPLRWLDTSDSWEWMIESWIKIYRLAGVKGGDRVLFAFSFGPFIGFWLAFEAATRLGCLCLPGGGLNSAARLRLILDHQINVVCCTPTYALRLAQVAAAEKIDLRPAAVRKLIVAGEPGGSTPATRARLAEHWPGAEIFDHHGMTEIGPVSYQCPKRPGVLHVMESAYLAEVIEPSSGQRRGKSERGELVLTTLGRVGSPLLRYRTGDLVQPGAADVCSCGTPELALEGGILGRSDDMLVIRGVNIFPTAFEEIIRECGGVAEYQVTYKQTASLPELSVCVEPLPEFMNRADLGKRIEKAIQTVFALRVPVHVVEPGSLPRFEMKARRWIKL